MPTPSLPALPGVGLVAILLINRSRPGPRLVFHYPEDPTGAADSDDAGDNEVDQSSSESDDDDPKRSISRTPVHARTARFADIAELVPSLGKLEFNTTIPGKAIKGGEILTGKVLGQSVESLEKMLSPGRWSDGKKFEICLDGLTFVGHPVYAPEDGEWTPKFQHEGTDSAHIFPTRHGNGGFLDVESFQTGGDTTPLVDRNGQERGARDDYDFTHIADSFDDKARSPRLGSSMESSSTNSGTASAEKMNMFHVVFVLQPEHAKAAALVYADVVKALSKALHYCQKQSNYVAAECRKLLAMKTKAKQKHRFTREDERGLWKSMVETSELAWSLKEIYERISAGEVAGFRLNGMEMALHISPTDPVTGLPEAWAASADGESTLDPNCALLLSEPAETLLAALALQPEAAPLTHFVQELTSTKSLAKQALQLSIPLPSILYLAHHLLKWRKAHLLAAPLHWRNIYVVAPNAPLSELTKHAENYKALFPTLPSLPNMLKVLSGRPIRYGMLVPSRDHRGKYMEILEFLYRHGFVVQLRTYGWLRLPLQMLDGKKRPGSDVSGSFMGRLSEVAVIDDDNGSVSSERTAIATGSKVHRRLSEIAAGNAARKRLSDGTQASVTSDPISQGLGKEDEVEGGMKLVVDPREEVNLLYHLQNSFEDLETREILAVILPHFDGEHAFENMSSRFGLKRSKVEKIIEELDERGWVMSLKSI